MTDPDADGISGFPYFLHYMSTLILCGRISTTSFYLIENILNGSYSDEYVFQIVQLSFDVFFLLFFILVLYLPLIITDDKYKKEGKSVLTVWAMEFEDIVAHFIVCLIYSSSLSSTNADAYNYSYYGTPSPTSDFGQAFEFFRHGDEYIGIYFVIYCINVTAFVLPLPWISNYQRLNYHPMIIHTMILDFITDLPFTAVSLIGATYVGHLFIAIDIAINIITFLRGILWVPVKFKAEGVPIIRIESSGGTDRGHSDCEALWRIVGAVLVGLIIFGPGIWLFINFGDVSLICDTIGISWSTWFLVTGFAWVVTICVIGGIVMADPSSSSGSFRDIVGCSIGIPLGCFYLIIGSIGCAMYDNTTLECRDATKGVT
eukprot:283902_1